MLAPFLLALLGASASSQTRVAAATRDGFQTREYLGQNGSTEKVVSIESQGAGKVAVSNEEPLLPAGFARHICDGIASCNLHGPYHHGALGSPAASILAARRCSSLHAAPTFRCTYPPMHFWLLAGNPATCTNISAANLEPPSASRAATHFAIHHELQAPSRLAPMCGQNNTHTHMWG